LLVASARGFTPEGERTNELERLQVTECRVGLSTARGRRSRALRSCRATGRTNWGGRLAAAAAPVDLSFELR